MIFSIISLFPEMFTSVLNQSILGRAQSQGLVKLHFIQLRDFATDNYGTVDDHPYGGGVGMILKVDVVDRALTQAKTLYPNLKPYAILLDPKGTTFKQAMARELTRFEHIIFICGRYEGVDARVADLVDASISIGDYVLSGGELGAMVITDAVARLIPGVLKKETAVVTESFTQDLLEYPQYTRPEIYKGKLVPKVLLSGNPKEISKWQKDHALPIPLRRE